MEFDHAYRKSGSPLGASGRAARRHAGDVRLQHGEGAAKGVESIGSGLQKDVEAVEQEVTD